MSYQIDAFDDKGTGAVAPDRFGVRPAADDAEQDCDCEFCSPEPEIMPLPRSGAARNAARESADDADGALEPFRQA